MRCSSVRSECNLVDDTVNNLLKLAKGLLSELKVRKSSRQRVEKTVKEQH